MTKVNSKLNASVMQTAFRFILTLFFKITSLNYSVSLLAHLRLKSVYIFAFIRDKISLTPLSYSVNIWSFYCRLSRGNLTCHQYA